MSCNCNKPMTIIELCLRDRDENGIENDQKVQTHQRGSEVFRYADDRPSESNYTSKQIWLDRRTTESTNQQRTSYTKVSKKIAPN